MVELIASAKIHRKTLIDLDIRARYGCNIVGIQRDEEMIVSPPAEESIKSGDILLVIGRNKDISRFEEEGI
jgi:trk system potassium uptake protein TrkA